jgi:branched-chain amino acid aminotransferase/4-amino-4-deoxychorismate lyase
MASAAPAPAAGATVRLARVEIRRNEGSLASRCKTLAYLDNVLARAAARRAKADEALMLNNRGELACAAAANLFWLMGETLFTPALDCGVLDGVMRAQVLEAARGMGLERREVRCGPEVLVGVEALFLTNSLIGVAPVSALDGRMFGGSVWTERLGEALSAWC